jgi:hypothetical protein
VCVNTLSDLGEKQVQKIVSLSRNAAADRENLGLKRVDDVGKSCRQIFDIGLYDLYSRRISCAHSVKGCATADLALFCYEGSDVTPLPAILERARPALDAAADELDARLDTVRERAVSLIMQSREEADADIETMRESARAKMREAVKHIEWELTDI